MQLETKNDAPYAAADANDNNYKNGAPFTWFCCILSTVIVLKIPLKINNFEVFNLKIFKIIKYVKKN